VSENLKKLLANQIKEDLRKDLAKVREDTNHSLTYIDVPWGQCEVPVEEWGCIVLLSPDKLENKGKKDKIAPNELERKDYEEIVSLIKHIDITRKEVIKQREEKKENEINKNIKNNSKCFFYEGLDDWLDYETARHFFIGWGDGKRYKLVFPENHPSIASLPNNSGDNPRLKEKGFYCIEGVEKFSLQPQPLGNGIPWKEVNLSDKVTITEYKENIDNPEKPKTELSAESKKVLKMVGGVVGILVIIAIIRFLLKRKSKI
jgi:hypothetical protein